LAAVGLALPIGQVLFVFLYDLDGTVAAAAVHDDIFKVRVVLGEDGVDALFQVGSLVVGGVMREIVGREFIGLCPSECRHLACISSGCMLE
jgi:predicted lipoprotein